MRRKHLKSIKMIVASGSFLFLILNLLNFLVKISYNNLHAASYYILLASLCITFLALSYLENKSIFNFLIGAGCFSGNLLFIFCMVKGNWSFALLNDIKWFYLFFQLNFALPYACNRLYKNSHERKLLNSRQSASEVFIES